MALYTPSNTYDSYKKNRNRWEHVWNKAIEEKNWKILIYCPFLLVRWQERYPQDNYRISLHSSCVLGRHRGCTTDMHMRVDI